MPRIKHGMYGTLVYKRWICMRSRCRSNARYIRNGITVCKRWDKFENFYADMGDLPTPEHTLDRIDGTKGYSPDNCRWATMLEQGANVSSNVRVDGRHLSEWARVTGLDHRTISYRARMGLDLAAPKQGTQTHCRKGHEFTEANTYWCQVRRKQGGMRRQRFCRICRAGHQADLRVRRLNSSHKGGR